MTSGSRTLRASGPWSVEAILRLVGTQIVSAAILGVGWWQVSEQKTLSDQVSWFVVGLAGLGLSGYANGRWFLTGRRAIGIERVRLLPQAWSIARPVAEPASRDATSGTVGSVQVPGGRYRHRPDCPFAARRAVVAAGTGNGKAIEPCGVCRP